MRHYNKDKHNLDRRQNYIREKKNYKKAIYKAKKIAQQYKLNRLADLEQSDPKRFWADIKSILRPRDDSASCIDHGKWLDHFRSLLHPLVVKDTNQQFAEYIDCSLPTIEGVSEHNGNLNKQISHDELNIVIKELKTGKATYLDEISNEFIKATAGRLRDPLLHLFNTVIRLGVFPIDWSDGLIIPIHKKDDRLSVDNYRGIIISSYLGKVFVKILTRRIDNYMRSSGQWSMNQCGFKPDHRTEDNLFILKTIHETYCMKNGKKIYVAFVDFSKFFDTINRNFLFYKLLKYGITGNIYKVIKSMYANPQYFVMINGAISPKFSSSNGVKQGCSLSPILSNIFQNDIHDIFQGCHPVKIGDISINSLSWADDLLLLSSSKEGLQSCLVKLHEYCNKWGLVVNESKTKSMVFSKCKWSPECFEYANKNIECVKSFQYLGFHISFDMKIKAMMLDRKDKAMKMANMLLRALKTSCNVSAKLSMSLFDKYVAPIFTYGSSLWGIPNAFNLLYLDDQPEDRDTRVTVTNVLQTCCSQSVPFTSARRVGRKGPRSTRRILINLKNVQDMELILQQSGPYRFVPYNDEPDAEMEKLHLYYCKRSLNVNKHASNSAVMGELGRYPLSYNIWVAIIKYWMRLNNGTGNMILNAAFQLAYNENHRWIQAVCHVLNHNGFKDVWLNPPPPESNFHVIIKQRLRDQYMQRWKAKISSSSRFSLLNNLKCTFERSRYIDTIKDPETRLIFTRLRIDMNPFSTYMRKKIIGTSTCPLCISGYDSMSHLFFECPIFDDKRKMMYSAIERHLPTWSHMDVDERLKYLLDLKCPDNALVTCCAYVYDLYVSREKCIE